MFRRCGPHENDTNSGTERELCEELESLPPEEAAVLALLMGRRMRELREAEGPKCSGRAKRPRAGPDRRQRKVEPRQRKSHPQRKPYADNST